MLLIMIAGITAVAIPTGIVYAKTFTMFGNNFDGNSECAEWALKYIEAKSEKPYNWEKIIQPAMMIGEKRCNPNP